MFLYRKSLKEVKRKKTLSKYNNGGFHLPNFHDLLLRRKLLGKKEPLYHKFFPTIASEIYNLLLVLFN